MTPVGLFGEHRNVTAGSAPAITSGGVRRIEREVVATLAGDDGGPGDPGDVAVQLVRRLEHDDRPARPGIRQQQRLDDLVGAVGGEDLLGAARRGSRRSRRAAPWPAGPGSGSTRTSATASRYSASHAAGGANGDSLVLRRTSASTCGEW